MFAGVFGVQAPLARAPAGLPKAPAALPKALAGLPKALAALPREVGALPREVGALPTVQPSLPRALAALPSAGAALPAFGAALPTADDTQQIKEMLMNMDYTSSVKVDAPIVLPEQNCWQVGDCYITAQPTESGLSVPTDSRFSLSCVWAMRQRNPIRHAFRSTRQRIQR